LEETRPLFVYFAPWAILWLVWLRKKL